MDLAPMKRFLLALALCLLPSLAAAQCNGVFPNNTFCGNVSGAPNIPGQVPNTALTGVPFVTPSTVGSGQSTTGTITSGTATLTLAGAIDFINGQGIRINHAGASFTLNPPTAGTVTPTGTPGGTAYAYTIASLNATGGVGQSITNITTATGNASLSATNFNHIAWTASSGGATAYAVYGRTAGSLTLLGITTGVVFDDIGQTGPTPPDWIPTAPQTGASLPSWLITTISSGASTTTLTLAVNASNTATTQVVIHDDTTVVQTEIGRAHV